MSKAALIIIFHSSRKIEESTTPIACPPPSTDAATKSWAPRGPLCVCVVHTAHTTDVPTTLWQRGLRTEKICPGLLLFCLWSILTAS